MLKENEIMTNVVKHWEEMIRWVKTQPKNHEINRFSMKSAIQQTWSGFYCDLCKNYSCSICLYTKKYGQPCFKIWESIHQSTTWGEWLEYAEILLKKLQDLKNNWNPNKINLEKKKFSEQEAKDSFCCRSCLGAGSTIFSRKCNKQPCIPCQAHIEKLKKEGRIKKSIEYMPERFYIDLQACEVYPFLNRLEKETSVTWGNKKLPSEVMFNGGIRLFFNFITYSLKLTYEYLQDSPPLYRVGIERVHHKSDFISFVKKKCPPIQKDKYKVVSDIPNLPVFYEYGAMIKYCNDNNFVLGFQNSHGYKYIIPVWGYYEGKAIRAKGDWSDCEFYLKTYYIFRTSVELYKWMAKQT